MANGEFLDALSESAFIDIKKYNAEVLEIIKNVSKVREQFNGITMPSQSSDAIKKLNADYLKQEEVLKKLQLAYNKLAEVKTNQNYKSSEEIINQRILTTNANRHAQANSTLAGAYRNLSAQVAIASEKYQNLIVRGKTAEQTQKQFNQELKNAEREFTNLQSKVLQADKAVDKWNRTGERSIGFAKNLISAFGIAGGVALFASITKDIFQTTKEIQSMDLGLKSVTETAENFEKQQQFL